jgi:heme-degrading monooxygenase HmoA
MPGELQHIVAVAVVQVLPGAAVTSDGGVDVVVSSLWESIPAWESWSKSAAGTQQHTPNGVYQYVPAKGEGFPEAFVPFRDYDTAVNAKY